MNNSDVLTQITVKNLLFATDFSQATKQSIPYAVEIAKRFGAMVHVAHVIRPDVFPMAPASEWPSMAQEEKEFRDKSIGLLEEEFQSVPHEFILSAGDVSRNLSHIIHDKKIDLIVLGTHGRTGIGKALMGSVAEEIFRSTTCPVFTVGHQAASKATPAAASDFSRILYPTDFSPESLAAAPYAISMAREYRAELILMHAIQSPEPGEINSVFQTLREVVPLGVGLTLDPKYIVKRGKPDATIVEVASTSNSDLIVLGVRPIEKRAAFTTRFVHSTGYAVVTAAACPVLTVH